jgi:CheY-like chemotaxis protein
MAGFHTQAAVIHGYSFTPILREFSGRLYCADTLLANTNLSMFATNAPDALETVRRETVDLILLDVMTPDMDGYEVCR